MLVASREPAVQPVTLKAGVGFRMLAPGGGGGLGGSGGGGDGNGSDGGGGGGKGGGGGGDGGGGDAGGAHTCVTERMYWGPPIVVPWMKYIWPLSN